MASENRYALFDAGELRAWLELIRVSPHSRQYLEAMYGREAVARPEREIKEELARRGLT
jgi:hypothetical protein